MTGFGSILLIRSLERDSPRGAGINECRRAVDMIEADALFFQKGSRIRYEMSAIEPFMARINELSIPVLVKVFFKPGTSPYILGGGEFAFVLTDGPKSVDYGLIGGIGFRKQLNNIGISLEARYHHGLQDMRPDNLIFSVFPTGLRKMRVFVFMLVFSI